MVVVVVEGPERSRGAQAGRRGVLHGGGRAAGPASGVLEIHNRGGGCGSSGTGGPPRPLLLVSAGMTARARHSCNHLLLEEGL